MPTDDLLRALDLFHDAALLVRADGTVLAANRAVWTRFGLDPEAARGRPLAEFVTDPAAAVDGYLRACGRTGDPVPGGLTLRRPGADPVACRCEGAVVRPRSDGDDPVLLVRFVPKRAAVGQFLALNQRIDELNREIARRRAAEAELRAERERLQVTLSSIGDAVIATDAAGAVTFLNPVAEALTGWPGGEAVGQPIDRVFDIVNEDTRAPADNPVGRVLREGVVVGLANHTVLRGRDGAERPIDDCAAPIRGDGGRPAGAVLVFHDVTAQRRAEATLRAAEGQLRFLTDAVPALLSYVDRDYRYRLVNRAYEVWFGHPRDEVLGRHLWDVMGEAAWAVVRPHAEAALAGEHVSYEAYVPYKDGGGRWISAACVPDVGDRGEVRGYVALVHDVTHIKRIEEALREADLRKDEFLAALAHELRNPLAPMLTGLRVLALRGDDPGARGETVGMLDRQVRHLSRLIDDLLDVSRITRGLLPLRTERLDLGGLVRTAVADYTAPCGAAGVAVTCDIPDRPVWVTGDPTRLTQVVMNLVQNACKFTDPGGRVVVRLDPDPAGRGAELRVRDTGAGIDPELLPRLFEPFSQGDRTLDRAKGGLGLGLALVRGLVELHGGRVEATSGGPGMGSEFVVRLPTQPEPAALSSAAVAPPTTGRTRRVLVIEDNRDAADSLRVLLEVFGHQVRVAYTGPDGVEQAVEWLPEVVVSDIGLPGLDGFGVAEALRADGRTAGVLLVAVTGYGTDETRERAEEAGFDRVLTKPADPTTLLQLLDPPRG